MNNIIPFGVIYQSVIDSCNENYRKYKLLRCTEDQLKNLISEIVDIWTYDSVVSRDDAKQWKEKLINNYLEKYRDYLKSII